MIICEILVRVNLDNVIQLANFVMERKKARTVHYYRNYYFDYLDELSLRVQKKFSWILDFVETIDRIPVKFLKHLEGTDGLYEIKVEFEGNAYRIFCFFDQGRIIVVLNCFQKKSEKTPQKEIELALKLKKQYFHEKK